MRYSIICLLLLGSNLYLCAQKNLKVEGELSSGYDQNIYRLPALFVNAEGDTLDDVLRNGWFSLGSLAMEQTMKWDQHQLVLSGLGSARVYPTQIEDNLYRGQLSQAYLWKINRKWKIYQEFNLATFSRNGQDDSQDVFSIPLSYHQYAVLAGTQWKPSKRLYTKLEASARTKIYVPGETASLRYSEKSLRVYTKLKMDKDQPLNSWEGTARYRYRNYLRESYTFLANEEEDVEEEEDFEWDDEFADFEESSFNMSYLNVEATVKIQGGDYLYWKPSLEWISRDGSNANLGYRELKPEIYLNYQKGRSTISLRTSYAWRYFGSLTPNNTQDLLRYRYWRTRLIWKQALTEQWSIHTDVRVVQRQSNFDLESSRLYRSYSTSSASLGLRWKIN